MESKHEQVKLPRLNNDEQKLSLLERALSTPLFFSEKGLAPSLLKDADLSKLSRTSSMVYGATKQELNQRAAQKLLSHVVLGEEAQAKIMLEANPSLLLIQSKAVDYSGRTIIAKPFQAALGAGDKPMWEMMLPYFNNLAPGEALSQYQDWFPDGIGDIPAVALQETYNNIAKAIINDKDLAQALIEQLRSDLCKQKEITFGKHFNLQHLMAAYQAYIDHFHALANWDNRNLFWQKVIGYVQRQMTAYDAQVHCSGVQKVLENNNAFSRVLAFYNGRSFFPLAVDAGLGFDFAGHVVGPFFVSRRIGAGPDFLLPFEKLCGAKTETLIRLRESLAPGAYYQRSI